MRVLLIALSLCILVGVGIMAYFLMAADSNDAFDLHLTANGKEKLVFEGVAMLPGESETYDIALRSDISDDYVLSFDFVDLDEDLELKKYVYAKIEYGDKVICDKLLEELFEEDPVLWSCYLSDKEPYDIKLTYYIPASVGNEAENLITDFELIITATGEEAR